MLRELRGSGWLLDVGCGEGYLLALLLQERPEWSLVGLDHDRRRLDKARHALGESARLVWLEGDVRRLTIPRADAVTCLDVLHYLPVTEQDQLLQRLLECLEPGGMLLVRDGEPGRGWRSRLLRWSELFALRMGRHKGQGLYFRPVAETTAVLTSAGCQVRVQDCNHGTPFANFLIVAQKQP